MLIKISVNYANQEQDWLKSLILHMIVKNVGISNVYNAVKMQINAKNVSLDIISIMVNVM